MRLVELLTLLGTLVGAFVTGIATVEQRLINKIRSISSHPNKKTKELSRIRLISKWRLSQLQKLNIIIETKNGEYHLDEVKYNRLRKKRVIIVVIFLIVSIFLIVFFH